MRRRDRGVALVDLIVSLAVLAILAGISLPATDAAHDVQMARLAAQHVLATLQRARFEAARRNVTVAVRILPASSGFAMRLFADGDGDGVRAADVSSGVDRPISEDDWLAPHFRGATFGVPYTCPAPETGASIPAGSDPLRFGTSQFVSFHPLGGATAGTAYITAGARGLFAVRVFGPTGRVRLLAFDPAAGTWRSD